ncbi:guanylate kinase [bacterium]|nr:MAG: guanylate kinase [bacterium]
MPAKNPELRRKTSREGELFIVSAPSGAGKTTLCRKLCATLPRLKHSVSFTTRPRRKNEKNNIDYSFISKERFTSMIRKGEFAEWATVHGNFYGTSIKKLLDMVKKGYDVILDVDVQGAKQLKHAFHEALFIFILPPSMRILEQRLRARMSDNPDEIKRRLQNARDEIKRYKEYDYIVINDDLKKALRDVESIITSRRLVTSKVDSKLLKNLK